MIYIDRFLNSITMYRLVLYALFILSSISIIFGYLHIIAFSGTTLVISLTVTIFSCYITNSVLANIFNVPANIESVYITALILYFVMLPATNFNNALILVAASIIAMGSKYVFTIKRKHIFNPVAIAAFLVGLLGFGAAIWWVATPSMFLPVLVLGLLIVRKIRRFTMVFAFFVSSLATLFILTASDGFILSETLKQAVFSGPIIFFGTIMLTEPLTTPPTKRLQAIYAIVIGVIYSSQFSFSIFGSNPETTLVIGNLFSFLASPIIKPILHLYSRDKISPSIQHFSFKSDRKFGYKPGQYLEWTIPHTRSDTRGIRRFFTIASSPTEDLIQLGVRIQDQNGSSLKKKMIELKEGDKVIAANIGGEFTLPKEKNQKLLFIAGGIGITPFRSMIKYLIDTRGKMDIILLYAAANSNDFVYKDIFTEGKRTFGLKVNYLTSFITQELIEKDIPDIKDRTVYLSGPEAMVNNYTNLVKKVGVPSSKIKKDYFPGF